MSILSLPESFPLPPMVNRLRPVVRFALLILGLYALWRGQQIGQQIALKQAAYRVAFEAELAAQAKRFDEQSAANMQAFNDNLTEIYRDLNTIFASTGLSPIGDD